MCCIQLSQSDMQHVYFIVVVMQRMLYKNSKRTLIASWIKYSFTKLLLMRSWNIYYVNTFSTSFRQLITKRFSKALAD